LWIQTKKPLWPEGIPRPVPKREFQVSAVFTQVYAKA
jgi:hypothetical protein